VKRTVSKLFFVLFLLAIITFPGCATLPDKAQGEVVPLRAGGIQRWGGIKDSGVHEDCDYSLFSAHPKGKKSFFSKTDKQATWWAIFQPAAFGFIRTQAPGFVARWYAPNGNLYWEDNFAGDIGSLFAKNSLPIAGTPVERFPGRWFVQIYYEGRLIDEKEFIISKD
jgi:hypothetical protein